MRNQRRQTADITNVKKPAISILGLAILILGSTLVSAIALSAPAKGSSDDLPPIAVAGLDTTAKVNQTISFDGSASNDPDGYVVSYHWNFGDGTSASGAKVSHAFSQTGTYVVNLSVTDNAGLSNSDSLYAYVCVDLQALANATATNGTLTIPACHYSQMVTLYHPITLRA
ncbi:MAG: PKD domain-containing protein, partial [Thermoplasmatota archaeon]